KHRRYWGVTRNAAELPMVTRMAVVVAAGSDDDQADDDVLSVNFCSVGRRCTVPVGIFGYGVSVEVRREGRYQQLDKYGTSGTYNGSVGVSFTTLSTPGIHSSMRSSLTCLLPSASWGPRSGQLLPYWEEPVAEGLVSLAPVKTCSYPVLFPIQIWR